MISIITRQFGKPDKAEITNISITINSYRISIGVAKAHYCSPREFQGMNPKREKVEVCVIDKDGEYATKEIFQKTFPENPEEIISVAAWVTTNDLIKVLSFIERL